MYNKDSKYHPWVQRYIDDVDGKAHQSAVQIITELSGVVDDVWNVLLCSPNAELTDTQRLVLIGDVLEGITDNNTGKPFYNRTQATEERGSE